MNVNNLIYYNVESTMRIGNTQPYEPNGLPLLSNLRMWKFKSLFLLNY